MERLSDEHCLRCWIPTKVKIQEMNHAIIKLLYFSEVELETTAI